MRPPRLNLALLSAPALPQKPECTHEGAAPLAGAARPDEQQHQQSATVEPGVGHPASQPLPMQRAAQWPPEKYSAPQAKWCRMYEHETTFDPLMCDYEAGNETFVEAARKSIAWFESWSSDAYLRCTRDSIPGALAGETK